MFCRFVALWVATVVLAVGCGSDDAPEIVPGKVGPTTGPYVVTAVDNHFHDIHPVDDVDIAADRPLVVTNEGKNLHNFTIVGTDVNRDFRPGRELRFPDLGEFLEVGRTYEIVCHYHASQGMIGMFTVVEG
jgi:hypothetical protein